MRRRFFNAADNFVGGCYNKLSNEDIKRLGGKRPRRNLGSVIV